MSESLDGSNFPFIYFLEIIKTLPYWLIIQYFCSCRV
jgi:hypothetical protein